MKNNFFKTKIFQRILWISALLAIWELIAKAKVFSPLIFPSVEVIFKTFIEAVLSGEIIGITIFSMKLILEGMVIGIVFAVVLSSLSSYSKYFEDFVETLISIADPLPGIALLPLIILWLGVGEASIVFIIFHSVAWPLMRNLISGFKSIPNIYKQVGMNYGMNSIEITKSIMLPAAMPYFLSGLKISWSRAWRALISAEMIFGAVSGKGGLGWYIFKKRSFMDTPGIFTGLLVIIIIGVLVDDIVFNKLEAITIKKWGMSI